MITHEQIKKETEELKNILASGGMEIPSMWTCLWPGLLFMIWIIVCVFIGVSINEYADADIYSKTSELNVIASFGEAIGIGFITMLGVASGRGFFMSIPKKFRCESEVFRFLAKKIKKYACVMFVLVFIISIIGGWANIPIWMVLFPVVLILFLLASIDFSRYQLAAFSNVISAFKDSKNA
ncbi:hypothetical protein ACVQ8M_17460 (plasmid) [Edwardsiella tarda]|uniref:hypothetical protein n=1 Tax=Edwardsiella TaxID=635 RepID=UPI001F1825E8|nr:MULTISPECIES: hypothetical protein [Edwardsiella]UJT80792.1 hypothetical protein L1P06_17555 [Edwardsiella piscicida]WGE31132.1 hypothetical protein PHA77_18990 [Edwardsiella tarda]